MSWRRFTSLTVALALLVPYAAAFAQSIDVKGLARLKQTLPVDELSDEYVAIKVASANAYDMGMVSYYSMMGAMLTSNSGNGFENYIKYIDLLWTKGDVVIVGGEGFLATYKIDFAELATTRTHVEHGPELKSLRLHLVRLSSLGAISPFGDVTAEEFRNVFTHPKEVQSLSPQQEASAQSQSVSNAKQLALAMHMYAADYDDIVPYAQSTATVQWVTYPYMRSLDLWETKNPNGGRVLFNPALAGVALTSVEEPHKTVLYYETNLWPDRRRIVAYADGHVMLVTEEEWAQVSKTLKAKFKKSAKPLPADYGLKELAEAKSRRGG